jgi:alkylhydroperoxidase family enzyme
MRFAEQVVADATSITQADVDRLREVGLSDVEIFDVAAAAAVRCFFSKLLDAVGAQPDASYSELDPAIRDVLVVGRPIASE